MARRSLRPHLNQIRGWVRQGRTDAWIAHQLEVTVKDIEAFKRQNELLPDGEAVDVPSLDFDDEIDLRAEDDALIAAELEAAEAAREEEERRAAEEEARRAAEEEARRAAEEARRAAEEEARRAAQVEEGEAEEDEDGDGDEAQRAGRRRGRRGGRGRRRAGAAATALEGTFDHGEEGYGLWLDPAVADNAVYAEHWAGHRPVTVTIEEDQIVIRRAGEDDDGDD
jgi:superfamily II DNA/RNA helicase